jgi:hypothetical protein
MQDCGLILAGESDDKIIRAAGLCRAALFVRAKSEPAGNLLGGGELLRKARVYVCKSGRLVMQASSELIEESSC